MESPVGLLSLPVEVLQHLSKYLSISDVLSCSETCHYLRSALNHNSVWRKYLPSKDISRLHTQYNQIPLTFNFDLQSSLSPICSERLLVIKKNHLLKNWRHGNYACKSAKTKYRYSSGVFNKPKGYGKLIYDHRYIFNGRFINDIESDAIEVWNIENEPVFYCALPIEVLGYDSFYIIGNYLMVIFCRNVIVYEITLPEKAFPIKYSFIITDDFVTFNKDAGHSGRHDMNCGGWSHSVVHQYLVSNKCCEDLCVLHVWDILNANKTGAFLSPIQGFSITFHSILENAWVLRQIFQSGNDHNYFSFDIKTKEFSRNIFKISTSYRHIVFHLNFVLVFSSADRANEEGWHDTICSLFDFNSSVRLTERQFNNARQSYKIESIVIVDGFFVMLCDGCFKLVDAISLDILETIACDPMLRFITSQYNLFGSLFVLASHANYRLELWDVKKRSKVSNFLNTVYTTHMYFDDIATKVVYYDYCTVSVAHFW